MEHLPLLDLLHGMPSEDAPHIIAPGARLQMMRASPTTGPRVVMPVERPQPVVAPQVITPRPVQPVAPQVISPRPGQPGYKTPRQPMHPPPPWRVNKAAEPEAPPPRPPSAAPVQPVAPVSWGGSSGSAGAYVTQPVPKKRPKITVKLHGSVAEAAEKKAAEAAEADEAAQMRDELLDSAIEEQTASNIRVG